jgi:hypothetical protein
MFKKVLDIGKKEAFYKERLGVISKIQDLDKLINDIKYTGACKITGRNHSFEGELSFTVCEDRATFGRKPPKFAHIIVEVLEEIKSKYMDKLEELERIEEEQNHD